MWKYYLASILFLLITSRYVDFSCIWIRFCSEHLKYVCSSNVYITTDVHISLSDFYLAHSLHTLDLNIETKKFCVRHL